MNFIGFVRPLVSARFWFNVQGVPFMPWIGQLMLALMLCLLLASGAAWIASRQANMDKYSRRIWKHTSSLLISAGLFGLVLHFFTWQRVPLLSLRALYLVWFAAHAVWVWRIWRYAFQEVPAKRAQKAERLVYEKWLPKPKRP